MIDPPNYPQDLFYGNKPLNIRFRTIKTGREYFCLNNRTLHLSNNDFDLGTYEAGRLLSTFCEELCVPARSSALKPCPAFVSEYMVGRDDNKGLASVEAHPFVRWEECPGVQALLEMTETPEERYFFLSYLEDKSLEESAWRNQLVEEWNGNWWRIPEGWGPSTRRSKFDKTMWWTMRFPALIPQVWHNWLHAASPAEQRRLDENPSRVDFLAFWEGKRYVVEVDGPSHYASYNEKTHDYVVDEREYARNLKIARSLQGDDWNLIRIARIEIKDVMDGDDSRSLEAYKFLEVLPFHHDRSYPDQWRLGDLASIDMEPAAFPVDDDIPF